MKLRIYFLLILFFVSCFEKQKSCPGKNQKHPGSLRVLSYNINFGMSAPKSCLDALVKENVDIILLQETTPSWEKYLRNNLDSTYPYVMFRHCGGAGGLAFISKFPISEKEYIKAKHGWFPAWIVSVDSHIGRIQLLNVHLRPPLSERGGISSIPAAYIKTKDIRLEEIKQFFNKLSSSLPAIVAGDFNEEDSGNAVTYLTEKNFTHTLQQFDSKTNTWRWPLKYYTLTGRLDHILISNELNCICARVIKAGGSDHLPVVADIVLNK